MTARSSQISNPIGIECKTCHGIKKQHLNKLMKTYISPNENIYIYRFRNKFDKGSHFILYITKYVHPYISPSEKLEIY